MRVFKAKHFQILNIDMKRIKGNNYKVPLIKKKAC